MEQKRIVVGVSGASGIPIAVSILKSIQAHPDYRSLMVLTDGALQTLSYETDYSPEEFMALADETFDLHDVGASISSGTFRTEGMIIAPCSMKTIAGIAAGYSDNLVLRAADVTMKGTPTTGSDRKRVTAESDSFTEYDDTCTGRRDHYAAYADIL